MCQVNIAVCMMANVAAALIFAGYLTSYTTVGQAFFSVNSGPEPPLGSTLCPPTDSVVFTLSGYNKTDPTTHTFNQYVVVSTAKTVIAVQSVPESVGFFVIQAHSFLNPIILSNHAYLSPHSYVRGTNVGLVQFVPPNRGDFDFYIWIPNHVGEKVFLVVTAYGENGVVWRLRNLEEFINKSAKKDPVPGGCNLNFDVEVAPYQVINFTENLVNVDAQAASVRNHFCEDNAVNLEMYHMYLKERDLSPDDYFDGIEKMVTVDRIRRNGWRVHNKQDKYFRLRTYYSAYPGTGAVYAVVAVFGNKTSAYVPIVSYACDASSWYEFCVKPVSTYWKVFCAVTFFWGLFICYFGHRFFKFYMFSSGFIFGGFVTYITTVSSDTLNEKQTFLVTMAFAFLYGIFWLVIWWRCGKPLLSMLLPVILNGALIASVAFNAGLADLFVFQSDVNFWTVFAFTIVFYVIVQIGATLHASFLCSSMLGSFSAILALDHYIGSNLRYIVINIIRRMIVYNFNLAVIHPPVQSRDIVLYCFWVFLVVSGALYQWYQHRGKPPFPPPIFFNGIRAANAPHTERTPLISGSIAPLYSTARTQEEN